MTLHAQSFNEQHFPFHFFFDFNFCLIAWAKFIACIDRIVANDNEKKNTSK